MTPTEVVLDSGLSVPSGDPGRDKCALQSSPMNIEPDFRLLQRTTSQVELHPKPKTFCSSISSCIFTALNNERPCQRTLSGLAFDDQEWQHGAKEQNQRAGVANGHSPHFMDAAGGKARVGARLNTLRLQECHDLEKNCVLFRRLHDCDLGGLRLRLVSDATLTIKEASYVSPGHSWRVYAI